MNLPQHLSDRFGSQVLRTGYPGQYIEFSMALTESARNLSLEVITLETFKTTWTRS